MRSLRAPVCAAALLGCGEPAARVTIEPVPLASATCGRPSGANQLTVTAFAPSGEVKRSFGLDRAIDIADLPEDTVQLGVELVIGGGAIGAAGKTAPLDFAGLDDGTAIPIAMVPPGGFCPVGPLGEARKAPLVARAGSGVLVVGGSGPDGPLTTAELYDPATGAFRPVAVPEALRDPANGLAGVVLTPLPDGRVVLTGGSRGLLTVFDPVTRAFGATFALAPARAFHAAIASERGVIVTGGCAGVEARTCNAVALHSTIEYSLEGEPLATGANLPQDAVVEGGELFAVGDGAYVLAGGFGTPGEGFRFRFEDRDAARLAGLGAQPVALDGGAVMTAFAPDVIAAIASPVAPVRGIAPDLVPAPATVAVVTPAGGVAPIGAGPALSGARLVALEDGKTLAIGGDTGAVGPVARVAEYDPTRDTWELRAPTPTDAGAPGDQPGLLAAPALVRLADGSVLVLGGEAAPATSAWLYRPSLVGPASGSITAIPTSPASPAVLVPSDPATVTRSTWVLASPDGAFAARALVGGPRMQRGSVKVTATVEAGGLALIAQQVAPDRALVAHLVGGEPVQLEQLGEGVVCTGDRIALPADSAVTATLVVDGGVAVLLGDQTVLACNHTASDVGAWGVAASGAGARVAVATVTLAR